MFYIVSWKRHLKYPSYTSYSAFMHQINECKKHQIPYRMNWKLLLLVVVVGSNSAPIYTVWKNDSSFCWDHKYSANYKITAVSVNCPIVNACVRTVKGILRLDDRAMTIVSAKNYTRYCLNVFVSVNDAFFPRCCLCLASN